MIQSCSEVRWEGGNLATLSYHHIFLLFRKFYLIFCLAGFADSVFIHFSFDVTPAVSLYHNLFIVFFLHSYRTGSFSLADISPLSYTICIIFIPLICFYSSSLLYFLFRLTLVSQTATSTEYVKPKPYLVHCYY
jgi:hypothetical protein